MKIMSAKAFLLLALVAAVVLLVSSEVAAKDLAETSAEKKNGEVATKTAGLDDAKHGGYEGRGSNGGHGGRGGHGGHGGRGGHGGYGGRRGSGGRCSFGCCRSDHYGRGCQRCCSYLGEAMDAETQADPHN
ncbi:glycine-rich protein-like [Herrania umbratica]|uniref:Glycine-rich protein-like n=1 Tax=Herrania umbratica TaxID=108875 RepID=A0A6J0ZI95_9ROSI|nr:glycine-rich protein-like [Herrania umbratica]